MNTNDERFDELWASMKVRLQEAREVRANNTVAGVEAKPDAMFPGRVRVLQGSYGTSTVSLSKDLHTSIGVSMSADQLHTIAAHCLVAAEEIEDHRLMRAAALEVTEALAPLTERAPSDDEQRDAA